MTTLRFFLVCASIGLLIACNEHPPTTNLTPKLLVIDTLAKVGNYTDAQALLPPIQYSEKIKRYEVKTTSNIGAVTHYVERYYKDGQKRSCNFLVNNKVDGKQLFWHPNAELMAEYTYVKGEKVGLWKEWYDNGKPKAAYYYTLGRKDSTWVHWFDNGQMEELAHFKENVRMGAFIQWYKNGQLRVKGNYNYDDVHGTWQYYNETGELDRTEVYRYGKRIK